MLSNTTRKASNFLLKKTSKKNVITTSLTANIAINNSKQICQIRNYSTLTKINNNNKYNNKFSIQQQWMIKLINKNNKRTYATLPSGATLISMPALSPTMTKGNIAKWLKKEGDKLVPGDLICEVETDKSTLEFEFQEEGYLAKILKPSGSRDVDLGAPIAILVDDLSKIDQIKNLSESDLTGTNTAASAPKEEPLKKEQTPTSTVQQQQGSSSSSSGSALPKNVHEIAMPALSPTMNKGRISQWMKKEGDKITQGEVLCSVETDKATVDFEFQEDGYLAKIFIQPGQEIDVGAVIALLAENKDDIGKVGNYVPGSGAGASTTSTSAGASQQQVSQQNVEQQKSVNVQQQQTATTTSGGRVIASPLAKKVAEEKGVNLSLIGSGTGDRNRIIKGDVEDFIASGGLQRVQQQVTQQQQAVPQQQQVIQPTTTTAGTTTQYIDIPVTQIRKVIAERLLESKRNIPHYYLTVEIEVDELLKARETLNKAGVKRGFKLSVNDFLVKAASLAMRKVPEVNSSWQDTFIRQYKSVDLSVAVQTDNGLITPIVAGAEGKGLAQISNEIKELAGRAKEGKLKPQEFQGGTFTISNLGMFGIDEFSAIINPPQACILAVGKTQKKVVPNENATSPTDDKYRIVTTMKVTLSCDHRVVDGAVGAQWLQEFKTLCENPLFLTL
ncbi:hypothetical protein ABK040_000984 [Willaertia magna]